MAETIINFNGDIHIHFHGIPADDFFDDLCDDDDFDEDESEDTPDTAKTAPAHFGFGPMFCTIETGELPENMPTEEREKMIHAAIDAIAQFLDKSYKDGAHEGV